MLYTVDGWNNFCRVFEIPKSYPEGFCFGVGKPVNFQMVDWFNPVSCLSQPAVSKKVWLEEVGEIETIKVTLEALRINLQSFLRDKCYVKLGRKYLVLCDFGAVFIFPFPK